MFRIDYKEPSKEFAHCWRAAGTHLSNVVGFGKKRFIRSNLTPILLDHLSFMLGNQIFFVHVYDADKAVQSPSSVEACVYVADLGNGVPCVMSMREDSEGNWFPVDDGWGLRHAKTGLHIEPQDYMRDEDVEISDWEVSDIANRRVIDAIKESGGTILSVNSDPKINPSIYFLDQNETPHFVIVAAERYPNNPQIDGDLIDRVKQSVEGFSRSGFLAEVTLVSVNERFDPDAKDNGNYLPLLRGAGYHQKFSGLLAI